jgi:hypothetical protein
LPLIKVTIGGELSKRYSVSLQGPANMSSEEPDISALEVRLSIA